MGYYPEHSQERDMGIAATVTFFIPRWRPAPWGTTHDVRERGLESPRYNSIIRARVAYRPSKTQDDGSSLQ
jgi:hypothetical protein